MQTDKRNFESDGLPTNLVGHVRIVAKHPFLLLPSGRRPTDTVGAEISFSQAQPVLRATFLPGFAVPSWGSPPAGSLVHSDLYHLIPPAPEAPGLVQPLYKEDIFNGLSEQFTLTSHSGPRRIRRSGEKRSAAQLSGSRRIRRSGRRNIYSWRWLRLRPAFYHSEHRAGKATQCRLGRNIFLCAASAIDCSSDRDELLRCPYSAGRRNGCRRWMVVDRDRHQRYGQLVCQTGQRFRLQSELLREACALLRYAARLPALTDPQSSVRRSAVPGVSDCSDLDVPGGRPGAV